MADVKVVKLSPEQKAIMRAGLIGLRKSYERALNKYIAENKAEFAGVVQKEITKLAAVLMLVEDL